LVIGPMMLAVNLKLEKNDYDWGLLLVTTFSKMLKTEFKFI